MKILVTGHNGYIGSVLAPMLIDAGHEVRGVDSYWFEHCRLFPFREDFDTARLDVRMITTGRLEGLDAVVHLAALCNDPMGDLNPRATEEINFRAAVELARLAKTAGVRRFVLASSCSLYGASDGTLIDEEAPFHPVSVYGRSKVLAERGLATLAGDDFSPVYLRFATAYGVSPKLRADLVVNNLVGYAVITGDVLLKSDGIAWRPLIHVEDIARAILAVCETPRELTHNQAYNVGSTEENYTVRDIADRVAAQVEGSRVRHADKRFRDARNYRVSCEKIQKTVTGFDPKWDLDLGIAQLENAFRRYAVAYADFVGARFERLPQLKAMVDRGELDQDLRREDASDIVTGD